MTTLTKEELEKLVAVARKEIVALPIYTLKDSDDAYGVNDVDYIPRKNVLAIIDRAHTTIAAENATLRAERDSYEASAVEAHRFSRSCQPDAILWQYSAAVGDVPPLLVTIWKQRKAAENVARLAMDASQRKETELTTLRASEAAALERVKVLEAGLADPVSVHANMLRGAIAMPSFANIKHLYAAEFAALTPTADKEPKT